MSETKFTPGPWKFHQPWAGFSKITGLGGCLIFGIAAGDVEEKQPDEVCEANARLIAAAPTMALYIKKCADAGDTEASIIWKQINANT